MKTRSIITYAGYAAGCVGVVAAAATIISSPVTALGAAILVGSGALTYNITNSIFNHAISKLQTWGKLDQNQAKAAVNIMRSVSMILGIAAGVTLTIALGFSVTLVSCLNLIVFHLSVFFCVLATFTAVMIHFDPEFDT